MNKAKVYVLIYLSMMLPIFLSAAPIDKYYVPLPQLQQQAPQQQIPWQKQVASSKAETSKPNVYKEFEDNVRYLSPKKWKELKSTFINKRNTTQNGDAKKYYQELINILDKFLQGKS